MEAEPPDKVVFDIVEAYRRSLSKLAGNSHEFYKLKRDRDPPLIAPKQPLHLFLDHAAEAAGIANSLTKHIEDMKELASRDRALGRVVHINTSHLLVNLPPLLDRARVIRNRAIEASIEAYRRERRSAGRKK